MIKKIIAFVLGISVLFTFSGCLWDNDDNHSPDKGGKQTTSQDGKEKDNDDFKNIGENSEATSEYYSPIDITVGYDSLTTDDQRSCYKELVNCAREISQDKTESGVYPCKMVTMDNVVLTESEIRLVLSCFKLDNPMLFWLTDNFGYSNTKGYTALQLYSYESPQKVSAMEENLMKVTNNFVGSIKSGLDNYSLEMMAHNMVIDTAKYADDVKSAKDDYLAFTPYGALVNKNAVCEGYAKAFQYLLARLGIKSTTVMGMGSEELHMWNGVLINDSWYFVDPSWDDGKSYSRYDYFNITESQLLADHTIADIYSNLSSDDICGKEKGAANFNVFVPECYEIADNYYVRDCCHFTDLYSYDNQEIINSLYNAADNGEEYFHMYIDPLYLEYTNAVDQLFSTGDQLFFSYADAVNGMYPKNTIDKDNIFIVRKENLSVVTVKLSYY